MDNDTKKNALPPLIGGLLADKKVYIDNIFADTWKSLKFNTLLKSAGCRAPHYDRINYQFIGHKNFHFYDQFATL